MVAEKIIILDPEILVGKPIIRGTRLAVEFILELLANGWSESQILENYPQLKKEDLTACLSFACDLVKAERFYPIVA